MTTAWAENKRPRPVTITVDCGPVVEFLVRVNVQMCNNNNVISK